MKAAVLFLVAGAILAGWIFAQQPDITPQASDPPARVARMNWLAGDVSFQPAGLEEWTDATVNFPVTTGDHLVTGQDSRAELHVGPNAIRLDQNANFGFLNLDDSMVQVSLTQGSMEIRLNRLDDDDAFEIATPNGAVTLLRTGDYRIDTDPDRDATMVTVRAGQAELYSGTSVLIKARETGYFRGVANADVRIANETDDFDAFTSSRDGNSGMAVPVSYPAYPPAVVGDSAGSGAVVSNEVTGAEDLSAYGSWQNVPQYGDVWVPPVDPGWAPYSDGEWAYVDPWGWTWVDAAPWGFAPFHYGRWAYVRNHWVWVPDSAPTVYAPALVAFYGGGASGMVTWFALGPRDVWNPPWRPAPALAAAANGGIASGQSAPALGVAANGGMAMGRKGSAQPANLNAPGAIRTMPQMDFTQGNKVRPGVALTTEGQPLGSSPQLAPGRESVLAGPVRPRPYASANRMLIARTAPPPSPILFSARQSLLAQSHGRPLAASQLEELRKKAPYAVMQGPVVRSSRPMAGPQRGGKPAARTAAKAGAGQTARQGP